MSQPSVFNTSVVASQKGVGEEASSKTRSTGSPLLDSLVLTQKLRSTAYLAQPIVAKPARQSIASAQAGFVLQSFPAVERVAASRPSRQSVPTRPTQASSAPDKPHPDARSQPSEQLLDKSQATQPGSNLNITQKSAASVPPKPQKQAAPFKKQASTFPSPSPVAPALQRSGKRLPNPSLERAAAVGMLDLSDKLLFGGEDDALISTCLGNEDPLTAGGDETIVLKYLSKQIAESELTKIKGRLPLAVRSQPETEPGQAVLDARNFKVVQAALKSKDVPVNVERKQPEVTVDVAAMGQQIAHLSQQVEMLTKELSRMASKDTLLESGEAA